MCTNGLYVGNLRLRSVTQTVVVSNWRGGTRRSKNYHYFVSFGTNKGAAEQSPNLEGILNFMDSKSFTFVSMFPMGNPSCKEMVFRRK